MEWWLPPETAVYPSLLIFLKIYVLIFALGNFFPVHTLAKYVQLWRWVLQDLSRWIYFFRVSIGIFQRMRYRSGRNRDSVMTYRTGGGAEEMCWLFQDIRGEVHGLYGLWRDAASPKFFFLAIRMRNKECCAGTSSIVFPWAFLGFSFIFSNC